MSSAKHVININGIKLRAYHGCLEEEAKIGGDYIIDIQLETDFSIAAKTDDLTQTIDYVEVYNIVKAEMAIRSKLIEAVAERIHKHLTKSFSSIKKATVKVTKLCPPMNGNVESVSVEII